MMTRAGRVKFPCHLASNDYLGLSGDPRLAEAAAAAAGQACLRLTGRASLTENDISWASRALAVVREHCHHGRNTPQAGRTTT